MNNKFIHAGPIAMCVVEDLSGFDENITHKRVKGKAPFSGLHLVFRSFFAYNFWELGAEPDELLQLKTLVQLVRHKIPSRLLTRYTDTQAFREG
jgi:hypothetical protein